MSKIRLKVITAMLMGLTSFGCASNDYVHYVTTQKEIQVAQSMAEVERYKAMASIASTGDVTTRVAAMFALQGAGGVGNAGAGTVQVAAPKSPWETAREWVGMVLPVAVQAYGINANKQIAVTQSNNSKDVAISTNSTFATMGGQIAGGATSTANVATAGFNSLTTMGTTLGNVATAGFTANQNIAQSGLTATQTVAQSGLTATQNVAQSGITGVQNTATAGLTAVQGTATSGITAVQNTATAGITGVQGTATNAITALTPP